MEMTLQKERISHVYMCLFSVGKVLLSYVFFQSRFAFWSYSTIHIRKGISGLLPHGIGFFGLVGWFGLILFLFDMLWFAILEANWRQRGIVGQVISGQVTMYSYNK